jgi:molecular chaperone GrpE
MEEKKPFEASEEQETREMPEEEALKEPEVQAQEKKEEEAVTIEALNDRYLRLNAEYLNFKKRTDKEKIDIHKYANEKFFMELLPVIDNIERALKAIEDADDHKTVVEGVNMIKKSFDDFLSKNGVSAIKAVNESFDPNRHHAVMTEENDEVEDETVLSELQVGYTLNDKVIRPSMVKVSKKPNNKEDK